MPVAIILSLAIALSFDIDCAIAGASDPVARSDGDEHPPASVYSALCWLPWSGRAPDAPVQA